MTNETEIKAAAVRILQQQKSPVKEWGTAEHVALVSNVATHILLDMDPIAKEGEDETKARKSLLRKVLLIKGLGGNSSQFRQYLVKENLLVKSDAAIEAAYDL